MVGLLGFTLFDAGGSSDENWISLNAAVQYRHPLPQQFALYIRAGPGFYVPEHGSNKTGAVGGLGATYEPGGRWGFSLGIDLHIIPEGMEVYGGGRHATRDEVRFTTLSLGAPLRGAP